MTTYFMANGSTLTFSHPETPTGTYHWYMGYQPGPHRNRKERRKERVVARKMRRRS